MRDSFALFARGRFFTTEHTEHTEDTEKTEVGGRVSRQQSGSCSDKVGCIEAKLQDRKVQRRGVSGGKGCGAIEASG